MQKKLSLFLAAIVVLGFLSMPKLALAKVSPTPVPSVTPEVSPTPEPRVDITQKSEQAIGPLEALLKKQEVKNIWPFNPIKYAIRNAISAGVPANTIVLLLLLPFVAAIIAAARHVIGIRGFGIFLPAALSVTFVATGPIVGISLFLIIVTIASLVRFLLRKIKVKLQYLPRMALILWFVSLAVLGVLFSAPIVRYPDLMNVSIFAVLILTLLVEDFIRVQLGKSIKTAISLTTETLFLSLISYLFLTFKPIQEFVLLNPEISLLGVGIFDLILAKYAGLRLMEVWRFRKLMTF